MWLTHVHVNLTKAAASEKSTANAILPPSGTGCVVAGSCFLLRSFEKEFSGDALSQRVPFLHRLLSGKGSVNQTYFGLSSFPSNQVVHVIDSDSVAQNMRIYKAQRQGNTHITLSPLLQLMGEPGKCWSKTEWPQTGAHSQVLRDSQETVLKGLYRSTQVLGALVICLWFPSMSFSKTGWNCTVYFQGRFTR